MPTEKIEAAVMKDAESQAAKTLADAKRRREDEMSRAAAENDRAYDDAMAAVKARVEAETQREMGRARHRGRLDVLAAKNAVLERVFAKAVETLCSLEDKEYLRVMALWLGALPKGVGGTLRVSERDKARFTKEFLGPVNYARGETGHFTEVVVDKNVTGGFIVEGEDFSIDQTIQRKIGDLREAMTNELAGELFEK